MPESKVYSYPRDNLWMKYLIPESRQHGARFNTQMLLDIVKEFTKEGDVLLDPMGGVGSILIASTLGRAVTMIELEERFYNLALKNREKIHTEYNVPLSMMTIIQGDNRKLLPLPQGMINCIITSPPYSDQMKAEDKSEQRMTEYFGSTTAQGYSEAGAVINPAQIGNLPHQLQRFVLREVYQKCYNTLSPGGRLIIVSKDSTKNKKRVEQGLETMRACIGIGFELEVRNYRQCQKTGFQNLHSKEVGYKPVTEEYVFVFRRA